MKRKNFKSKLAAMIVFLLVGVLGVVTAVTTMTGKNITNGDASKNSAIQATSGEVDLDSVLDKSKTVDVGTKLTAEDKVGYIIEMDNNPLIETYLASPGNYSSFADYLRSFEGRNAAENLKNKQNALFNKIARKVKATFLYNYTNVMNGFSLEISYGDRFKVGEIALKAGAKSAYVSERFEAPQVEAVENQVVAQTTGIFDSTAAIDDGINGEGILVAVLDTGLDWQHVAFSPYNKHFAGKANTSSDTTNGTAPKIDNKVKMKEEDVEKLLKEGNFTAQKMLPDIAASSVYVNEKVPFAFDYADRDTEVSTSVANMHGTHVAGIIAGHSDTPYLYTPANNGKSEMVLYDAVYKTENNKTVIGSDGMPVVDTEKSKYYKASTFQEKGIYEYITVGANDTLTPYYDDGGDQITGITGVAPKAQLAIMKTFSDFESGADGYLLLAALNDCILLDVDVINMSLGADCGFQDESLKPDPDLGKGSILDDYKYDGDNVYESVYEVYERINKTGISLVVAASNSYSSGLGSHYGLNLTSNPDSATVGSPSSYDAAFSVASISGVKSKYISAKDNSGNELGAAYYNEGAHVNGEQYDFMNDLFTKIDKILVLANAYGTTIPDEQKYEDEEYTDEERSAAASSSRVNTIKSYIKKKPTTNNHAKGFSEDYVLSIPYVTIYGVGDTSNYAGVNVTDKIVLVSRGEINFEDKIRNAESKHAIACIVYNNAAGEILMQMGDDINIPACSITMDSASSIRNKDNGGTSAVFEIDPTKEAGPFMSSFSSWGPLPNLVLKPEITAHGGEIYSAAPGDPTSYDRISGTSMACPNMAGVVALLRQYMKQQNVAQKFGILDKNDKDQKVDSLDELKLMKQRIYQILMSTATIAINEEGNPYSPRKQGAGLADLEKSRSTEQYLYLLDEKGNEKERNKIEFFDDPEKEGVYEGVFYVRNVGDKPQDYKVGSYVMTEGISTDGKTVNEKPHMLTDYTASVKVESVKNHSVVSSKLDGKFTVSKGNDLKITYTITLGAKDREWLAQFKNGMYVEGFFYLTNVTDGENKGCDLNVPYLAFYGDWADAPIIDYDVYQTSADENNDTINDDDKRYAGGHPMTLMGKLMENGSEYVIAMGQVGFTVPEEFEPVDAAEDKCALSFNTNNGMCELNGVGGFLRGAKRIYWQITDTETGEVLMEDVYYNARKSVASGSYGGAWLEIDVSELGVINNHRYNFSVYPVLDWPDCDNLTSIALIEKYNRDYNSSHPDNQRVYKWDTDFWIDSDAPFISDASVRTIKDSNNEITAYYLDLSLTDNHYLQAMSFDYYDTDANAFVSAFSEEGMRPLNGPRNSTITVSYNITSLWPQIREAVLYRLTHKDEELDPELAIKPAQFRVLLYDYAYNRSFYTVDLYELIPDVEELAFGEIGNYGNYANTSSSTDIIEVLNSYNNTIATDANGNKQAMKDTITIIPKQKVDLMKAVMADADDYWEEGLVFSTADTSGKILKVDPDEGEIYGVGSGTTTVTVTSRKNDKVKATITVKVLSESDIAKYGINASRLQANQNPEGLEFKGYSAKSFNAGETYVAELESNPWYLGLNLGTDNGQYFIKWSVSNTSIATINSVVDTNNKINPYKIAITANDSSYDANGKYIENKDNSFTVSAELCQYAENGSETDEKGKKYNKTFYSATFSGVVLEEFVLSGNELTEYHGTPKYYKNNSNEEWIPTYDANGKVTNESETDGLLTVKIPAGIDIKSIGSSIFYERDDIQALIFGEGIETISRGACAYMTNLQKVVFPSTLTLVDEFAFTAYTSATTMGPETHLSIVDFSRCEKPIQVARNAFTNQRYIGVDMSKSTIKNWDEDEKRENKIELLPEETRKLFDLSKVIVAGDYSFYGLNFVSEINITGLRSTGLAAFFGLGNRLAKYFGPKTATEGVALIDEDKTETDINEQFYQEKDENDNPLHAKITLGPNVAVGEAAFAYSNIYELTLPMSRINSQMFFGEVKERENETDPSVPVYNGSLHKITFTGKGIVIGSAAFVHTGVKEVEFAAGSSVSLIGEAAFFNSNLEKVTFAKDVTCEEIGRQAFGNLNNEKFTAFTLPKGLKKLGNGVFAGSSHLTTINIDEGCELSMKDFGTDMTLDGLEPALFAECESFKEFKIVKDNGNTEANQPAAIADENQKTSHLSVKNGVLLDETGKKLIAVPSALNKDKNTEEGKQNAQTKEGGTEGNETYTKLDQLLGLNGSGSSDGTTKIEEIGRYAFGNCAALTGNVDLSDVNKIGDGAFYGCEELTGVKLSKELTEIPNEAFYSCTSLEKVNMSDLDALERIGYCAFINCEKLDNISFKNVSGSNCKVKNIEYGAFYGCSSLKKFTIPFTVTSVEAYAFYNCTSLEEVTFNRNITIIDSYAFFNSGIKEVKDLGVCTMIGHYTFANCYNLEKVDLDVCQYVGQYSFAVGVNADGSVDANDNDGDLAEGADKPETSAKTILRDLPLVSIQGNAILTAEESGTGSEGSGTGSTGGETGGGETDEGNEGETKKEPKLTTVKFGKNSANTIEQIDAHAFDGQTKLSDVNLNTAMIIGEYAFYRCESLKTVDLSNIYILYDFAFASSGLEKVTTGSGKNKVEKANTAVLPATLTTLAPTAFTLSNVNYFEIQSGSKSSYFTDDQGIVYRQLPSGGYEFVYYPSRRSDIITYDVLDGTTRVAPFAFAYTTSLMKVNLPSTVTSIGDGAFIGSSVRVYSFASLNAPELETETLNVETEYGSTYFWQIYRNFYMPFSYSDGLYDDYKYNPIRLGSELQVVVQMDEEDENSPTLQNASYTGGGFSDKWYGIMICRPSNGVGYNTFVWANYFDDTTLLAEAIEPNTELVIEQLRALPDPSTVNDSHRTQIRSARSSLNNIKSDQQVAFIRATGLIDTLVACEDAIAAIDEQNTAASNAVIDRIINELPENVDEITLDHKDTVVSIRSDYNALSSRAKALCDANVLAMQRLSKCEQRIAELEQKAEKKGCGSCGTVAFGTGGGIGLAVGLIAVMLACVLVVLFARKKRVQNK